jgi:7-keto-8-aminopelargonate synthetase-like enzyme
VFTVIKAKVSSNAKFTKRFCSNHDFWKGLGCHGAAILGSEELKQFLINLPVALFIQQVYRLILATILAPINF